MDYTDDIPAPGVHDPTDAWVKPRIYRNGLPALITMGIAAPRGSIERAVGLAVLSCAAAVTVAFIAWMLIASGRSW